MPSGAETLSNTPNTVLVQEQDNVDALHIPKKQKQEPVVANAGAETEVKPKRSFKAIANLVIAMKRFQCEYYVGARHPPQSTKRPSFVDSRRFSTLFPFLLCSCS